MEYKEYEKNLERLKEIIADLEKGELTLDENLSRYRQGIALYQELDECLKNSKGELLLIEEGMPKPVFLENEE